MKTIFKDILKTTGVRGVILFAPNGRVAFKELNAVEMQKPELDAVMYQFVETLGQVHEIEVVFERQKIYVRRTESGYLLIFMELSAPMAMVRLNCDMVIPALKMANKPKGLSRFFKKK